MLEELQRLMKLSRIMSNMTKKIIPAILPKDFFDLKEHLERVKGVTDYVQIDICNSTYTPSKTWPFTHTPDVYFKKMVTQEEGMPFWEDIDFELDLMIKNPEEHYEKFLQLGPKKIIFHFETMSNPIEFIQKVKEFLRDYTNVDPDLLNGDDIYNLSSFISIKISVNVIDRNINYHINFDVQYRSRLFSQVNLEMIKGLMDDDDSLKSSFSYKKESIESTSDRLGILLSKIGNSINKSLSIKYLCGEIKNVKSAQLSKDSDERNYRRTQEENKNQRLDYYKKYEDDISDYLLEFGSDCKIKTTYLGITAEIEFEIENIGDYIDFNTKEEDRLRSLLQVKKRIPKDFKMLYKYKLSNSKIVYYLLFRSDTINKDYPIDTTIKAARRMAVPRRIW